LENLKEFVNHISRVNGTNFWLQDMVDEAEKQLMLDHKKPLVRMSLDASSATFFTRELSVQMARSIKKEIPNVPEVKILKKRFEQMLGKIVSVGAHATKAGVTIDENAFVEIFKRTFQEEGVGYFEEP
jgi:hypothetical protein